ncbi:hypothetical protein [Notoacmeibacter ruber]|uniref:Porin n=1 Tax=Notoacmeibacter ruber TaxID=2670375 RepID=A0A3L7JFE1_9HYPH|nr:hypothetical protein [Notoacmeibacter ruber]RLQ88301.1 hypothetical protein D8780_08875 [Notoacmeibacter ruber]
MRFKLTFAASVAVSLVAGVSAHAADLAIPEVAPERFADLPAVDGFNGKISGGGYYYDVDNLGDSAGFYGDASFSAPLGERFGLQADAAILAGDGDAVYGGGLHGFTRDPSLYLAGIYGELVGSDSFDGALYKVGAEGEVYLNRFSVEAFAGVQGSTEGGDVYFNGDLTGAFYPVDNLRLSAGIATALEEVYGEAGAEFAYQTNSGFAPAVFVDSAFNEDFVSVRGGLRVYFGGKSKSLIERHRQDDPKIRIGNTLDGFVALAASSDNDSDNGDGEVAQPPKDPCSGPAVPPECDKPALPLE